MDHHDSSPTAAQIRAGRALLGWSQGQLAERSGIGRRTVAAYENGGAKVTSASVAGMTEALLTGGVRFSMAGEPEGVHLVGS